MLKCFDRASQKAKILQSLPVEQRGVLCGLPVTIKDLTDVEGVRSTSGSLVYKDTIPKRSTRYSIESVLWMLKFNDVFGITRSPHNTTQSSGGSSGGAAASLAAGCAWLSHGSDMAGSLRTPASFCGVTSLRPSPGTIRSDSKDLPYDVLGAEGPMARNISDLALFADVMRNDKTDNMQAAVNNADSINVQSLKIAISTDLGVTDVSDEVSELFSQFVQEHLSNSRQLSEKHPELADVHEAFDTLRANVFATGLETLLEEHRSLIKPEVIWNVEQGIAQTSQQLRSALRMQGKLVSTAADFMRDVDVLICPATSIVSAPADIRYPKEPDGLAIPEYYRWLAIAYATTMTTLPIITLPVATAANGMPVAIQLIGKPWGEAALFKIAHGIERMVGRDTSPVQPVRS